MTDKKWLLRYIREELGGEPEYLFKSSPDTAVFRHESNRKWYAALMTVSKRKLGFPEEELCDIVDLKSGPILSAVFRGQSGVFPGYHMNKEHWITVLLDGSVPEEQLRQMVELSYDLTDIKAKKKEK